MNRTSDRISFKCILT